MAGIIVNPRARIFHGHEWVYATEIKKTFGEPNPGDVITIKDFRDRPMGSAIYNPHSQIVARRFSRRRQELDVDFFERRLRQALLLREELGIEPRLARLVWSESDGLPGVIIDRYADHFVLQTLTLAMDQRKKDLIAAIENVFSPETILVRNDSPIRAAEGLEPFVGMAKGTEPKPFIVEYKGLKFEVDLSVGQKTGLYLDQLDNYHALARFARGRRVLDCFSNQGGFALACAMNGAAEVTAVDISEEASAAVTRNATLNNVAVKALTANVFDFLKQASVEAEKGEKPYDLIILDPPSFARSRKTLNDALRGYKEIQLRAMKLLDKGGILATYCCSHHATREIFHETIVQAAVDAKVTLRQMDFQFQRLDHPILATIPETEYLKGFVFQLVPGR